MPPALELVGMKFGRLTVAGMVSEAGRRSWICDCDCGRRNPKPISGYALKAGIRTCCGCTTGAHLGMKTHGMSHTRLYKVWSSMKHRCSNPNDASYALYGGRGIYVCDEWQSFEGFRTWALESGYEKGLTLERLDSDGPYAPPNCTWVPKGEQSNNTSRSRRITFRGETRTLKDWAIALGIPYARLQGRIYRGWGVEEAFTAPPHMKRTTAVKYVADRKETAA